LIVALKDDDFHVRAYAAASLGQIKDATAVEPLIATLKDTNASVRQMSTYALGQIADPRAVDALIIALKDNDCNVRASAAIALGEVGDSRAVSPLIAALQDRDAEARSDAAVSRFNRIALGTIIANAELSNTQSPASVALTRIGAPAISPLVAALRDGNPDLRAGAAVTLGYIKDARAVEPLIEALKGSDADLARRAAVALGTIGTAAAAAVNAALKDPDPNLRHRVATALSQAGVIIFLELAYSRVGSSPTFSGGFSPSLIVIAFPFFGQLIQFV
jgi:HEAT repeat protein